ncbi:DUF1801 domain-containing protein [Amylibacter sp. SFDW26]|uniref:DUF1801 domain-containing protein n=1 Tax=Amylibacter sp. SFDW26 TaxID=2652722 RepID=UPI001261ADC7|nr:DUF1801 domain-containing protein [Amylibacter sp. SFDW26]KAB7614359.1 DUF1801 domain-containing protein [Amylibacter sp. SFDW26]
MIPPITNPMVQAAYDKLPAASQKGALMLRDLIYQTAHELPETPPLTECLRWGQPSYITPKGSTLRIGVPKSGAFALYAHCQSTIISQFALTFGNEYKFDGNRAVIFDGIDEIDAKQLKLLIKHALTYKMKP